MRVTTKLALVFALAALMVPAAQAALVGHWTFDEATSGTGTGTALDSSGNGGSGTIHGGATYTTGRVGTGALTFDGTNDYVQTLYSAGGTGAARALDHSNYTIAFWAKWTDTSKFTALVGTTNWANFVDGYGLYYYGPSSTLVPVHNYNGVTHNDAFGSAAFTATAGLWQHIAVTYDSATTRRTLYVDGVDQTWQGVGGTGVVGSTYPLTIGVMADGSGVPYDGTFRYFSGAMDDLRLYNTAESAGNIAALAAMMPVPEPSTLSLLFVGALSLLAYAWRKRK